MKILYLITRGETIAGAQRNVLDLASAAHEVADVVVCASDDRGPLAQAVRDQGITFEPVESLAPGGGLAGALRATREVSRLIERHQPDLIHAHSSMAGLLGRLLAHVRGIPCVFTAHGWSFVPGVPLPHRVAGLAIEVLGGRLDAHVVVVSSHDERLARRLHVVPSQRLHRIECGIADRPVDLDRPVRQPPNLLMTARFERQKDHDCLLHALARTVDLPWRLTLAGDGPLLDETRQTARRLGLDDRISFLGFVRDMDAVVDTASAFVLTTRYEGLPISIMEALRAGMPVVATDVGGVGEAVHHGVNGWLLPTGDVDACARALRALLTGTPAWDEAGQASRRIFEQSFTLDRMVTRTFDLYETVLADHHAS